MYEAENENDKAEENFKDKYKKRSLSGGDQVLGFEFI